MKILFYNLDKTKYELLKPYINCEVSLINDDYKDGTLNELLETNLKIYGEGQAFAVYSGFSQEMIAEFVKKTKELVPMIHAAVTEHNISWTIGKLVVDLEQEHELFKYYERLYGLLNGLNSKLDLLDDNQKSLVLKAYMQYQNKEENMELLKESIDQLERIDKGENYEV